MVFYSWIDGIYNNYFGIQSGHLYEGLNPRLLKLDTWFLDGTLYAALNFKSVYIKV